MNFSNILTEIHCCAEKKSVIVQIRADLTADLTFRTTSAAQFNFFFNHLRSFIKVRSFLFQGDAEKTIHAFISTWLVVLKLCSEESLKRKGKKNQLLNAAVFKKTKINK